MFAEITWQQGFVFILILIVFLAFIIEKISPDIIAMGAMVIVLVFPGLLPEKVNNKSGVALVLDVLSYSAPIIIACMFVLSAALERTGLIKTLSDYFEKIAGNHEKRVFIVMFFLVAALSAIINNTPIVVIFLPIILSLARKNDFLASRFLIPLSYAAIVGGTCSLIGTSTNIITSEAAASTLDNINFRPIGMFEITKMGIIYVAITFIYLLFFGKKLLPERMTLAALFETKEGKEYLTSALVDKDSPLIGKKYSETELAKTKNLRIIELSRKGTPIKQKIKNIVFEKDDQLLLKTSVREVMEIRKRDELILHSRNQLGLENIRTESAVMMEGIVGTHSPMLGKTLQELNFRQKYDVIILAVHRHGKNLQEKFDKVKLAFGDTLLIEGPVKSMNKLFSEKNFINLSKPKEIPFKKEKAPFALIAIFSFLLIGSQQVIPLPVLALCCVFFVLATGCLDSNQAYQAIEWRIIMLIIGMMGLGKALELTGGSATIASFAENIFGKTHPGIALACIYLLTAILTELISNQAVAVLLTPIAIKISQALEVSPYPFIIVVMLAASASFATPIGYQTNTYVYGAGGYEFKDFTKVGLPLAIILWLVASLLVPVFWPFNP